MAALNEFENDWEEIETISLRNEDATIPSNRSTDERENASSPYADDEVETKETSFISSEFATEDADTTRKEARRHSEKDASSAITKPSGRKTPVSPLTDGMTSPINVDRESTRTRESRRTSTDTMSFDGRSITSQSDARSYRERLKDRINIVKERAGVSASTTGQKYAKANLKSSKMAALTRITNMLLKEEEDVKEALERHNKSKEQKKREKQSELKDRKVEEDAETNEDVSYETSLEFFTRAWKSSEEIGSTESIIASPQSGKKNDIYGVFLGSENAHTLSHETTDENAKFLAADYLGLKDTLMDPVEFKAANMIDKEVFRKRADEVTFRPCTRPVPLEQRIGSDGQPRDPKEEGLYVPKYPEISKKSITKLYQRLVAEKNTKWFGEDGELIRLADPMEPLAYHPFDDTNGDHDISDLVRFEPALLFGTEQEELLGVCVDSNHCYVLELKILGITFTHHPLFNREHVLANQLMQLYEKYRYRVNVNVTKRLCSKLKALRTALDNLKMVIESEEDTERLAVHKERLHRYRMEIKKTRQQRMLEGRNDNALLINLLSTWKDLKRIRALEGYTSTNVKLQILKTNDVVTTEEWQNEVKRQVEEIVDEIREEKLVDEPKTDHYTSIEEATENIENHEEDVDVKSVRERVVEECGESIPTPGEPCLNVTLVEQDITPDNEVTNPMEIQRRSLLSRSRVWFRIFYNGHEVCKSSPQPLERQFVVTFNKKFSIRLQEWPETLSVQIYSDGVPSKGIFNDHPLVEIFLPLPSSGATLNNVPVEKYEFSSSDEVGGGVRHSGVGSGVSFKLFPESEAPVCLYTTASIMCQIGWGTSNEQVLSPPESFFQKMNSRRERIELGMKVPSDQSKLKEWFKTAQLDPNDPSNVALFELLKKADTGSAEAKKYFDLNRAQRVLDYCSEDELNADSRLRLLMLRDRGEMEFKNIKAVPLREREIPKDIFKSYEKRMSNPELPFDTFSLGQLEIHRAWGQHSLNLLYDRILKQCRLLQQHRNIQDVIHEERVPDIGTLGLTFMKLLQPKRPLRPRRKGRKRIPVKGLTGQEVKVIVNVVRAFEVPVRKDVDTLHEDNITYVPVRPFVEVTFKGQSMRTVTADGPNPTWNQDLCFSLIGPNDGSFQVSTMHSFNDSLHIHLFDEIMVDILEDERMRNTTIHQRLERHWLGSLRIPFSTLYFNHQVEGTFQMYSPPFLLGYDRQTALASSDHSYLRNSTFLTLFIIVQPPLSPPDHIMEHLECSEPLYLEQHLESWLHEVQKVVPHRPVKTLVTDVSGKSVCVTRFFRPIEPPVIYENETTIPEMIARYVSLIPVSTSGALLFGHFNVWLTCDQTIKLLLGEREDHAILLCCFLMKLGLKAWLLFGNGIPHGHSAYVLTRHDAPLTASVYTIWDPVTGLKYSSMDSFAPLQRVYCLINDENIWVNTQNEELVRRTNFDLSQRSDWWPAFGRDISTPTNSVQPDVIEYSVTSSTDVHSLQDKIEKHLRDSIMKWRPTSRTVWNRYCISILRKLLPIMEREACGLKQQGSLDHFNELHHILASHKICGFPISQPFTNIKAIIEAVKSTGVHANDSPGVEFALAVYVHSYPNEVLSVWVYAASLVARR